MQQCLSVGIKVPASIVNGPVVRAIPRKLHHGGRRQPYIAEEATVPWQFLKRLPVEAAELIDDLCGLRDDVLSGEALSARREKKGHTCEVQSLSSYPKGYERPQVVCTDVEILPRTRRTLDEVFASSICLAQCAHGHAPREAAKERVGTDALRLLSHRVHLGCHDSEEHDWHESSC